MSVGLGRSAPSLTAADGLREALALEHVARFGVFDGLLLRLRVRAPARACGRGRDQLGRALILQVPQPERDRDRPPPARVREDRAQSHFQHLL